MLVGLLKGMAILWPFLKELLIGNKEEVKLQARRNKTAVMLSLALVAMFLIFLYITDEALQKNKELQDALYAKTLLEVKLSSIENDRDIHRYRTDEYNKRVTDMEAELLQCRGKVDELEEERGELIVRLATLEQRARSTPTPPTRRTGTRSSIQDKLNELRNEERSR
ncbi:MAG: hypothetical protein CL678_14485 [Bdellovibrionaceae bacterium]|nr:hypothetical protein [Pseudobdellovibrionaceae bacterium]